MKRIAETNDISNKESLLRNSYQHIKFDTFYVLKQIESKGILKGQKFRQVNFKLERSIFMSSTDSEYSFETQWKTI